MGVHIHQHPPRRNSSDPDHSLSTSEKEEALSTTQQLETGGIEPTGNNENVVHKQEFYTGNSIYAKLHRITGRWGVEERGIERLPSDERDERRPMSVGITVSIFLLFLPLLPLNVDLFSFFKELKMGRSLLTIESTGSGSPST